MDVVQSSVLKGMLRIVTFRQHHFVVILVMTLSLENSLGLKDRQAMLSQFVFVLKMRIKQAFSLVIHMRFLFSLRSP